MCSKHDKHWRQRRSSRRCFKDLVSSWISCVGFFVVKMLSILASWSRLCVLYKVAGWMQIVPEEELIPGQVSREQLRS